MTPIVGENQIRTWCINYIARVLNAPQNAIDPSAEFDQFGLDSALTTAMIIDLEAWLKIDIPPAVLFEQTTLNGIAAALSARLA